MSCVNVFHYRFRLTVRAMCKMKLRKYPLDEQNCPLHIGSCMYIVIFRQDSFINDV